MNIPGYRVNFGTPEKVGAKTEEDVITHAPWRGGAELAYRTVDAA